MAGRKQWSDMPHDLLSQVADRLDLIDLMRFRAVCKDFHAACYSAITKLVSSELPWFLSYGTSSECSLLIFNNSYGNRYGHGWHQIYTLNIPELVGATVYGSSFRWLLVCGSSGKLFFLHPFSRKKINFLRWDALQLIKNYVAAFSSPPSSQDCIVAIAGVHRNADSYVELNVFRRRPRRSCHNSHNWECNFRYTYGQTVINAVTGAAYCGETFYFFDGIKRVMLFHPKNNSAKIVDLLYASPQGGGGLLLTFRTRHVDKTGLRKMLGLDDSATISTCGTAVDNGHVICSEFTNGYFELKGVWIRP